MSLFYGDNSNKAKQISKIFYGNTDNIAKEVKQIYLGDEKGKPKKVYSSQNYKLGNFLTFHSETNDEFTINVNDSTKHWDGTLYYSTDSENWKIWDGTSAISSVKRNLYFRGLNNTIITGSNSCYWVISGSVKVACYGNMEALLDYEKVAKGEHPIMADNCYSYMFYRCSSLTQAPELLATTLTNYCYFNMFQKCTSLTQAPKKLPATTLATCCYAIMFSGCTSLTQAPELPATTITPKCYALMFYNCTSLTQAPKLPATKLAPYCYQEMFNGCISLTQAPELPATTLSVGCYMDMFNGCTQLTEIHLAKSVQGNSEVNKIRHSDIIYYDL